MTPTTRWCVRSATRGRPTTSARFAERFDVVVTDSYGSTEGGATVPADARHATGRARPRARRGPSCSTPTPATECPPARFDDSGRLLNAEEAIGELVSKGGGAGFEGYWRNDDAERARLRDGWYWTGDLAYRDEAGFFYFAGRDPRLAPRRRRELRVGARSSGSSNAIPTWCWPPSTPCPTPSSGTR